MKSKRKDVIINIFFLCLFELFFFRYAITTDALFGDIGDGRFCNYVTDHWYKFLTGKEQILDANQFFPAKLVFTYSDLFLGLGPIYALLRCLGFNLYNAFKYTIIVVHFLGTGGMLWFLRKNLRCSHFASIIGMSIFAYANVSTVFSHPQYMAIYFLPYLFITISAFIKNISSSCLSRIPFGIGSIVLFALIFYTSGYTGYYTAILILTNVAIFLLIDFKYIRQTIKNLLCWIKYNRFELFLYIFTIIIILIPFAICYIPIQNLSGGRNWNDVLTYLPTFSDFFSINTSNWLYGVVCNLGIAAATGAVENGFPLFTFIFFVFSLIKLNKIYNEDRSIILHKIIYVLGISVFIISFLILKIRPNVSLWYFIYKYMPGASSMRAVGTFMLMFPILIAICIAFIFDTINRNIKLYLMSIIILLQYIWAGNTGMYWNMEERLNFLQSIKSIPIDCHTMYVSRDKDKASVWDTIPQMTSWEIAEYFEVNNIGGYNSFYAEDWDMIDVSSINYEYNAWNWICKYNIQDVYEYNLDSNQWKKISHFPDMELVNSKLPSSNATYEPGMGISISPGGRIAGPMCKMQKGKYKIEIYGEQLDQVEIVACDNNKSLPVNMKNHSANQAIYEFFTEEQLTYFYIAIINNDTENNIFVKSFKIIED